MGTELIGRSSEWEQVCAFLESSRTDPSAMLLDGEAGIGKTTLLLAAADQARADGNRVLSARPAATESVLAYAGLADLLDDVEQEILDGLPEPQRRAIDRILLTVDDDSVATDPRAVAAAVHSVLRCLAERSAVLIAIDDLQWLDASSAQVIAFAARRLTGPVGILATVRPAEDPVTWLQMRRPDALQRISLQPFSIGALRALLTDRLGRAISRASLVHIHQVSGGNPFYAIELGRDVAASNHRSDTLPPTLTELVRSRIAGLDAPIREALLAVASASQPTVELMSRVLAIDPDEVIDRLRDAERDGLVTLDHNTFRFSHPLLAHGVRSQTSNAARRSMHRRLAAAVDQPELRAKHLALAATHGDDATLQSLDEAAELARVRGAPGAAAEFLELAIDLGGDTARRRIQLGSLYFSAGDAERARQTMELALTAATPPALKAQARCLLGLWSVIDGSSRHAADLLQRALDDSDDDPVLRVQILALLSFALLNAGQPDTAARWAGEVVGSAESLGPSSALSVALSMAVFVRFLLGHGFDETVMDRALSLSGNELPVTALMSPTVQRAQLLVGVCRLDEGRQQMLTVQQQYLDSGEESELIVIDFYNGLSAIWQGRFAEATAVSEEAMQRAQELNRDLPRAVALLLRGAITAYTGEVEQARRDAGDALALATACDAGFVAVWPRTTLGFLELSLGNHDAAVSTLQPLLPMVAAMPMATEIFVAPFLPDAAEALIQAGRPDEAEPMVNALESNGRRLDRPWMLACGARCRALLLAARGDLDEAAETAQQALIEHNRLPMPFERARTQLLLGQLQRRQRHREAATATIRDALATFETLGTTRWAEQARRAGDRVHRGSAGTEVLTATEQRIAELAASGMTNREVGTTLFISAKTVEVHLSRIYRKLGIRSRSELGWQINRPEQAQKS